MNIKQEIIKREEMIVWTYAYRPFIMGGNVHAPIGFKTELGQEIDLGNGYSGYEISLLSSRNIVVEKQSGAIIGNSLEVVREDIKTGDPQVMIEQVRKACDEAKRVDVVSQEEFCRIYK